MSKWRALGVAITKARRVNVEGSIIGLRRAKGSVKAKERVRKCVGEQQDNRWRAVEQLMESAGKRKKIQEKSQKNKKNNA